MITINNINKYFNRRKKNEIHVINNTSLEFDNTGLVALLGPSGSGKTTLLNVIGGLDKVNSGNIFINGKKITRFSTSKIDEIRNLNIGYIFQNYNLIDDLSVFDNVAITLKMIGIKDSEEIKNRVEQGNIKVIEIQRSKGYSTRESLCIDKLEKVIKLIKDINKEIIIMVDNCYCEFVNKLEATEVGADIIVGSLIKNLGGGIASNGGYICGKRGLIKLCAERLNVPGEGKEVGPSLGMNKSILLGLFLSPKIVSEALKVAILTSKVLEEMGYQVEPKYNDERVDIVQNIFFNDKEKLIKYCEGIQESSPIDSNVKPIPSDMPGYSDKVIMASGSFTQGSSIELSCDGPLRSPYILYQQGSLTYEYGKIAIINAINKIKEV